MEFIMVVQIELEKNSLMYPLPNIFFSSYFWKIIYDHFPYCRNKSFTGYNIIKPQFEKEFLIECCHGNQYFQIKKISVKL